MNDKRDLIRCFSKRSSKYNTTLWHHYDIIL